MARNPDGTYGTRCSTCRQPINYAHGSAPGVILGRSHQSVGNRPELALAVGNWAPAHLGCNMVKGDHLDHD